MAAAAAPPTWPQWPGSSPCASFVEETLLHPTRNARLFAPVFALVFAHTFVFLAVAVLLAHPLVAVALNDGPTWSNVREYVVSADKIREHASKLLLLYLAYLASKLAAQAAVALAVSATWRGGPSDRSCTFVGLVRGEAAAGRVRRVFVTAALVAVVELASTSLPAACHASWWRYGAMHPLGLRQRGVRRARFPPAPLPPRPPLPPLPRRGSPGCRRRVGVGASAGLAEEGGGSAGAHFRRAWRLMTTAARRKEAAVQVLVVSVVLPVATYPVYSFALDCAQGDALWLLGILHGFLLPPAGVQLYSTVAATVFYHRCVEQHQEPAIPLTVKLAKLSETLPSPEPADRS